MIQLMLNFLLLAFTMIFTQLKHPLSIGFLLMIQTIITSIFIGLMHESFWFSYILFLVFIGGMLVLFIYVSSLASNELFSFSFKMSFIFIVMVFMALGMSLLMNNMEFSLVNNKEMFNNYYLLEMEENFKSIFKLYNFNTYWVTIMLINYLFFTLIISVKITNFHFGPLRNLN